ncbi:transposase domain-containing protein (plasmid) [Enterocloster clostridioformis]
MYRYGLSTVYDNNATEGSLRSFCLHKHAWKLIDSINGAQSSAIIYSITETAKANNLNPFRYLEYILTVMKDHQEDTDYRFMEELLPWSEQLPEICKSKTKTTNV